MTNNAKQRKEMELNSSKILKEKSEKSFLGIIKTNENNFAGMFY